MFLDEVASGVPPTDAPAIARDLGADAGQLTGLVLACFYALAMVLEPPLLRLAERYRVRWVLAAALFGIAAVTFGASFATTSGVLLVLVALYGPLSGVGVSSAEGTLVELAPDERERTMARLTLAAAAGDLAVPGLIALVGWRDSFRTATAIAIVLAIVVLSSRALSRRISADEDESPESSEPPPRLRDALRNRALVGWTLGQCACALMDEVALAFIAVHLHGTLDRAWMAIALTAFTAGSILGLAALDRLLTRFAPMSLLAIASALALPSFVIVVVARDGFVVCAALAVLGAAIACFYPIVKARSYASLPGHPGVVNAVGALFSPLDIVAAIAIGTMCDALGSQVALASLALVPVAMLITALRHRSTP